LKEKYELQKSILQAHLTYSNILDELEYVIQRNLNEQELKSLMGDQYYEIEMRLERSLTEEQLRNILQGKYDDSLIEIEDLLKRLRRQYEDNHKRTRYIATQLLEKLDREYQNESINMKSSRPSSRTSSVQQKQSDIKFQETTTELFEQSSNDVRKHAIVTQRDSLLDSQLSEVMDNKSVSSRDGFKNQKKSLLDKDSIPTSVSLSHQIEPIKAFENITRIVEQTADKEHIEETTTVTNAIDRFQENLPKNSTTLFLYQNNMLFFFSNRQKT